MGMRPFDRCDSCGRLVWLVRQKMVTGENASVLGSHRDGDSFCAGGGEFSYRVNPVKGVSFMAKTCPKCGKWVWLKKTFVDGKHTKTEWCIHWRQDALPTDQPCENSGNEVRSLSAV